ncbi:MAG: transcriptional repressor [Bacilli bacterium]|nr:transcriptional repressor [Bacilli bacterium]
MKKRNTIQKQIILDSIKNTKSHPDVNELLKIVKEKDSTIGKSSIYRNLNSMIEDGSVKLILTNSNSKRYDGNTSNHNHFVCNKCNKVIDIMKEETIDKKLEKEYNFIIQEKNTTYFGICDNCILKKNI